MAYTEYLDIVIRNQGKLDALEKQTKAVRDNLEAINRGPAAVAAPSAAQPLARQGRQRRGPRLSDALGADLNDLTQSVGRVIRETDQFTRRQEQRLSQRAQRLTSELRDLTVGDSRALRGVRQTTRLQQARESRQSLRRDVPASQRPSSVTQALRGTLRELAQADARQLREIEELTAPFLGGSSRSRRPRRTPIRGASSPNLITGFVETGGGGSQPPRQPPRPPSPPPPPSGGPPDDPDRFRRRVGQVQTRVRFAERYGPQLPSPDAAERSLAYQARLNAQVRQYQGQLIKARQIVGPARDEVVRIAKAWEDAGGAQIKSLALAQAYSRELRALNTEQVTARSVNQFQQRGPGQRALIEGRARAVANELPETQRPALLDGVRARLQAQEEALNQGNRSEALQQERLAAQEIALRRQEVAESKRAERRARAPQQARTAANRAQRLSRQANEIEIPRTTPLGQELFNQAAAIASEAAKQERALRQSVTSGKATTDSVKALTANITELRSAFETLKTRAQPLQQAAKAGRAEDVARRRSVDTETQIQQQQRDRARKLGQSRDADIQKRQQDELTAFQKSIQLETQLQQQQRDRARKLGQSRDKGIQDRQREEDRAFARAAESENRILQQQRDRARKLGQSRDAAIQKRQQDEVVAFQKSVQNEERILKQQRDQAIKAGRQRERAAQERQKAQREEVSAGAFTRNIGRVLGGGGDTQDFESLALGAGFPLLFGGGPGSIAGGLLGSFVGKGFGGQILGGAIGQIVDDLIASTARLGNALNDLSGNFDALRAEGVRVSSDLERRVLEQRRSGDFAGANETLRTEIGAQMGDVGGLGLQQSTAAVNALSASWDKIYKTAGLTAGLVAGPFAVALAGVLEIANGLLAAFNAINTGISTVIRLVPGAAQLGDFLVGSINDATGATQAQLTAVKEVTDELVRRGAIEQQLDARRTAASGLSGANKTRADAEIAAAERLLAFEEEIRKLRQEAPTNAKGAAALEQQVAVRTAQFRRREEEESARTRIAAEAAALQTSRERQDRERALAREAEGLLRRQEDLAQSQIDLARQEFDLQRSIADFRIRTEDQIASRRADLIRQELEIARIRGQIDDSQISSRFDRQIEAAPDDRTARILSAGKEEELARKALERTIRDGRIETALRIDQIERTSRQEQRALENDRIALERQRDAVIRARVAIERQTEDLKRDTADYQLSIARQVEDSAIRAANELRAAAAGLLQSLGGATGGGTLINGGNANAAVISDTLRRKLNLPDVAIAGLLGNLEYESPGLNPRTIEGGGQGTLDQAIRGKKGYGISQLTSPDRQQGLLRFAGGDLNKAAQVQTQAEYLVLELTRNYAGTLRKLRSVKTVAEAVQIVQDEFLRPDARAQNTPQRLANAQRFLSMPSAAPAPYTPNGGTFDGMFGRTGRMSLAAGYGMVDVRGGNRAAVRDDAIDIIRANSARGIQTKIGGDLSGDVDVSRLNGEQLAKAVERGIDRHASRVGKGTFAIDLIAPENTRVGLPLSGISNRGGNTGVAGTTPRGNLALHLAALGALPPIPVLPPPPGSPLPGVGVGTAPFDLRAQAERDKQLQRERQQAEEALRREELRRREEETLREVVGEQSVVRKREELELTTRIAAAGVQSTEAEQRLLELRIANTREQELLTQAVEKLGPLTKEREAALAAGLANKREELKIAEALLEIEKQRAFQQELVSTQREIQNFSSGIDAGFGVGTQASSAFAGVKNRGGTDEQARRQADAVRTLTLLQETVQDAQSIGGSIGDGIRNALIASVTGGDIRQAFSAMFATIGNTLIQSALRPIEQLVTDQAFSLLRPNLTAELGSIQENVAAQQQILASAQLGIAGTTLTAAGAGLTAAAAALTTAAATMQVGSVAGSAVGSVAGNAASAVRGALGFAAGGNPPIGQPAWVGEQGPELSVARGLSTIIPNETSTRLWDSLSSPGAAPGEGGMGGGEVAISYDGPTLVFDSTNYVKQDDVPKIVDRAVKQSFGYSQRRMQESPAARRAAGMR